ncbi:MAG: murein biosynthesis integral membrane protein MurJ [Fusobacteriaceae bacterium]
MEKNKILKSIIGVTSLTLLYRVLGFFREMLIAYKFGVTSTTDAYFVANSIQNMLIEVMAVGAISAGIIPVFIKDINDKEKIRENTKIINGNFILISIAFTGLVIIFGHKIIGLLVPGFSVEVKVTATLMLRISILSVPFLVYGTILKSILNLFGENISVSFSNVVHNVAIVLVSLILSVKLGIYAFIISLIIALGIQAVTLYFLVLKQIGHVKKMKVDFFNEKFKEIIALIFPIMFALLAGQINFIIDRIIASKLEMGSISSLNYANRLIQMPLGVIMGAISVSTFPVISKFFSERSMENFSTFIEKKMEILVFIFSFISIFVLVFSEFIVSVAFERGEFTLKNVEIVGSALKYYSFTMLGMSLVSVSQNIFYSAKKTKFTSLVSVFGIIINIVLNLLLVKFLDYRGLALATTMANVLVAFALIYRLVKKEKYFSLKNIKLLRCFIFSTILFMLAELIYIITYQIFRNSGIIGRTLLLIFIAVMLGSCYFGLIYFNKLKKGWKSE